MVPKDKTPITIEDSEPQIQLRYETFLAGNEYVGPDAADDDEWVRQLFDGMVAEWPNVKGKAAVEYVDQF